MQGKKTTVLRLDESKKPEDSDMFLSVAVHLPVMICENKVKRAQGFCHLPFYCYLCISSCNQSNYHNRKNETEANYYFPHHA